MAEPRDPMKPPLSLLMKLGSAAVHADEMRSYNFDPRRTEYRFDRVALDQALDDPDVKAWIAEMTKLAFLPVKR